MGCRKRASNPGGEVGLGVAQRGAHAGEQLRQFVHRAPGLQIVQADRCLTGEFDRHAFGGEPTLALVDEALPS
jgi:hypothetical protein